jgi:hypothetical protein
MVPCPGTCVDSLASIQRLRHCRKCPVLDEDHLSDRMPALHGGDDTPAGTGTF